MPGWVRVKRENIRVGRRYRIMGTKGLEVLNTWDYKLVELPSGMVGVCTGPAGDDGYIMQFRLHDEDNVYFWKQMQGVAQEVASAGIIRCSFHHSKVVYGTEMEAG